MSVAGISSCWRHACRYSSLASRLICVPAKATETGQVFFVSSACSRNFASSIPGTSASVFKSIDVIFESAVAGLQFYGCRRANAFRGMSCLFEVETRAPSKSIRLRLRRRVLQDLSPSRSRIGTRTRKALRMRRCQVSYFPCPLSVCLPILPIESVLPLFWSSLLLLLFTTVLARERVARSGGLQSAARAIWRSPLLDA